MKRTVLLFSFVFLFVSCKDVLENSDSYVESLSFQNGSYTIYEEGMTVLNVTASPTDSFSFYSVSFDVENPLVCEIKRSGNSSCIVYGRSAGSTVVTAEMNGKSCYTVVNVRENTGSGD